VSTATTYENKVDLAACMDRLEAAIDPEWENRKLETWKRFLDFEPFEGGFRFGEATGSGCEHLGWPGIPVNEAIRDPEKMLARQLGMVYRATCRGSHEVPNIRCNYGTGILSSLFGAEVFWMPDELDVLPTTRAFGGGKCLNRLLEAGEPDINAGWGARVFETAEYFTEQLAAYPKLNETVWIYHPDLQGPMDIAEMMLGGELLLAFCDRADDVRAVMELVTTTYIRFLRRWFEIVPPRGDGKYMAHWNRFFKGRVMLRDDSLVNLSPEMYAEFVRPCDQRILDEFGGGAIHFCGKCDHAIGLMSEQRGLTAVNPSQPHLNDVRKLYDATIAKGIVLDTPVKVADMPGADFSRGLLAH